MSVGVNMEDNSLKPNVIFVFSDQHRAQSTGFSGDPNVKTPCMDRLAAESIQFTTAVAGMPVCSPYRASLITGRYPLTHGIFINDLCLNNEAVSIAQAFNEAGYDTAYIGKWHLDGHGRSSYIPRERRQGFDFWQVLECTHNYNNSYYYKDTPEKLIWDGYDAEAQTRSAQNYIKAHERNKPFVLFLSWGPPHNPYETAPAKFRAMYNPSEIELRPNIPEEIHDQVRNDLAGYYAHISALDELLGNLMETVRINGLEQNTIFVYTSDHGDMIGSQGYQRKQKPWDESLLVPFLLRYPAMFGMEGKKIATPINAPDIMPTLLGLCDISIPETVEGIDFAPLLKGEEISGVEATVIEYVFPFGEWYRGNQGREYRGIRTERYTYVRDLKGPWLLYDNRTDPYQMNNICDNPYNTSLQEHLDNLLTTLLEKRGDMFLPGEEYVKQWGYKPEQNGTIKYIV
jgi:arylsulfatase A-like enzyme